MYAIFEDYFDSPISKCIKVLLGDKAIFTGGNRSLINKINRTIEIAGDEQIIVFVDVVPDNVETVKLYHELINDYSEDHNVIILPQPCAEYAALLYLILLDINHPEYSEFMFKQDIQSTIFKKLLNEEYMINEYKNIDVNSFEVFCKHILNTRKRGCVRNKTKQSYIDMGSFWFSECNHDFLNIKCYKPSLYNKALGLLMQYPIMPIILYDSKRKGLCRYYDGDVMEYIKVTYKRIVNLTGYDALIYDYNKHCWITITATLQDEK